MEDQRLTDLARYAALLEAASEGIFGLDAEGRVTFTNRAAEQMLGWSSDSLLGVDQHERIHHSDASGRPMPADSCPIRRSLVDRTTHTSGPGEVFWRADGTCFPVAYTAAPLRSDDSRVSGAVITFSDLTDRLQRERLEGTQRQQDAERVAERAALVQLQQTMQPADLLVPGLQLGACYLPAHDAAAGGDLYDWVLLPDGAVHLSVVDVVGKGVAAAKDALAVTHALRLLALAGHDLSVLVAAADDLLTRTFPDLAATVVVGSYAPGTGVLRVADGGHPPALLVGHDVATYLEAEGRPIGWPMAGSDQVVRTVLPIGASVVLYTDGLIETRRDLEQGLLDLRAAALEAQHLPPAELASVLVHQALDGADRVDDALAVVLRRT